MRDFATRNNRQTTASLTPIWMALRIELCVGLALIAAALWIPAPAPTAFQPAPRMVPAAQEELEARNTEVVHQARRASRWM